MPQFNEPKWDVKRVWSCVVAHAQTNTHTHTYVRTSAGRKAFVNKWKKNCCVVVDG